MKNKFRVEIVYCTKCKWLLRSSWMAQEILSTFDDELLKLLSYLGQAGYLKLK